MGNGIIHLIRYLFGFEAPESQTTIQERAMLVHYAAGKQRLAEIGVFEGLTTALLAKVMAADGVLYGIDPFYRGRFGVCYSKWIAQREVNKARPKGQVVFVEKLSFDALPFVTTQLDFLFIDGDHSWQGISRDWMDWSQKMFPGGIIALHDSRVPSHDSKRAELDSVRYFEEQIKKDARFEIIDQVDSLSILRRKLET